MIIICLECVKKISGGSISGGKINEWFVHLYTQFDILCVVLHLVSSYASCKKTTKWQNMNPKLKDYTGRELLEIIISNQVNLAQTLFRMNDIFLYYYGEDYINKIEHKWPTFNKLIDEHEHLLQ